MKVLFQLKVLKSVAWHYNCLQWPPGPFPSFCPEFKCFAWSVEVAAFSSDVSVQIFITNVSFHQSNTHITEPSPKSWVVMLSNPPNHWLTILFFSFSLSLCCFIHLTTICSLSLACCSLKERSSWGQKVPGTWRWMTWKTMMTISSPPRNHWSTREGWAQRKGGWVGKQGTEPSW